MTASNTSQRNTALGNHMTTEPTPDRPETLQERIATLIQEGHIKGETSYDTAKRIESLVNVEAIRFFGNSFSDML